MAKSKDIGNEVGAGIGKAIVDNIKAALSAADLGKSMSSILADAITTSQQLAQANEDISHSLKQVQADIRLKNIMVTTGLKGEFAEKARLLEKEGMLNNFKIKGLLIQQHKQEHLEEELHLIEGIAKWQLELNEELEDYATGWEKAKSKIKAIITDPQMLKTFLTVKGLEAIKEGLEETVDVFKEIRAEGFTMTQAFHESQIALGATFSMSGASLKENAEIMAGITSEMGSTHDLSSATVAEVGKMSKTLGISATDAGKLQGQFQSMAGATAESATNTLEYAGALAKAAHVAPGDVMKSIAANSEDVATYTKDGGKNIATAAVAAKKLGVEFGTITKMSSGLLDFENSINKQLEASVLLGREINLDKARELSLNGDLVGATQEMLNNIGGEAEYNKMNVLQRKALADSMGVSVGELSKMVKHQDELKNLTEEQQMALAEGSMTMDEVLANAGGVASRLKDGALSVVGMVGGISTFSSGLKESASIGKSLIDGFKSGGSLISKLGGALKGAAGLGPQKTPMVGPEQGSQKDVTGGLTKVFEKMNPAKLLAGAAALAVAAGAMWVLGKAMQEFKNLGEGTLEAAGLSLLGLTVALAGLSFLSGPVLVGAAALLVGAAAIFVLGKALQEIGSALPILAEGMAMIFPMLGSLASSLVPLSLLGPALLGIAGGLGAIAFAGTTAIPALAMLTGLAAVSDGLSGIFGGGSESGEEDPVVREVRKLGEDIKKLKIIVNLDGRAVGDGSFIAAPIGSVKN